MRNLKTPLAPSTFGPGGGKKKGKMGGGKCRTKSKSYGICGPKKKKEPTKTKKVIANIAGTFPILGGITTAIMLSKKNK